MNQFKKVKFRSSDEDFKKMLIFATSGRGTFREGL